MQKKSRSGAARARLSIRGIACSPDPVPVLAPLPPRWSSTYRRWIAAYLGDRLSDAELRGWERTFTALHELVLYVLARRAGDAEDIGQRALWARVTASEHLRVARIFTRLPRTERIESYVPHLRAFIGALAERGAIAPSDARRLDEEYAHYEASHPAVA